MTNENKQVNVWSVQEWANQTFVDLLENHQDQITIDEEGYGQFPVSAASVSVWAANTI